MEDFGHLLDVGSFSSLEETVTNSYDLGQWKMKWEVRFMNSFFSLPFPLLYSSFLSKREKLRRKRGDIETFWNNTKKEGYY